MSDDERPFYDPQRRPKPRQPQPGELLTTFEHGQDVYRVELRDNGEHGVEAQFFVNGAFWQSCRFTVRALAVRWVEQKRAKIVRGEYVEWP